MFKNNFIKLCNQRGESPSSVCRKNGITPATFSRWTEASVPRQATLMRIADYFGVTVDDLLRDNEPAPDPEPERELFDIIKQLDESDIAELERFVDYLVARKKTAR